jgi:hypothetical protein
MAANIIEVVTDYEERVRRLPHVPALSCGCPMLRDIFNISFSTNHF